MRIIIPSPKRLLSMAVAIISPFLVSAQLAVSDLTVEYMKNPSTVDETAPRLSWVNSVADNKVRGERQTAYRIVVASTREKLDAGDFDLWDSGEVLSEQSTLVPYNGRRLSSGQDCYWKVQTWNSKGKVSDWSEPAYWGMGLLKRSDWRAQWITAGQAKGAPLFRKKFSVRGEVRRAKAYVTGGGYFELYMNGKRVGDDYLVPNFTNYTVRKDLDKGFIAMEAKFSGYRVLYLSYDITDMLRPGENVAGAILGDGFYRSSNTRWIKPFGEPCLLCQIELTYADGSKDVIPTDISWLTKPSAIIMNGVYDGEVYDARLETPQWAEPGCDETDWKPVQLAEAPIGKLTAHTSPTDRICEVLKPVGFTQNDKGEYEVDFGKEISGWIRISNMKGEAGSKVTVRYISESPLGTQEYIMKGDGSESYAPRFTWYVFSKAVISGVELRADQLQAEAVNTNVPLNSEFRCSNELFNKILRIWQRSQMDNMHGCISSDCPHRERSPYTGDGQITCSTVMQNFEAAAFFRKWMRDIRDAQNPETGYVPNGAPWQPGCGGGVAWGAAMNVMPWEFYLQYGDIHELEVNYRPMKEQVRHMLKWLTPEGTMNQQMRNPEDGELCYMFNLGDHASPYKKPGDETVHTFYLWLCAEYTALAARTLGHEAEYNEYHALAERVKAAYHRKFYQENDKTYGDYGPNVLALWMGGLPEGRKDVAVEALRHEIMDIHGGHIHVGFITAKFLLETLTDNGLHDVAMTLMNKTDFPSFGNWIRQGATTTWEEWDGQHSHNHPMYGGCLTWFPRRLAGINIAADGAGYKRFEVRPVPTQGLDSVYYSQRTVQGTVSSRVVSSGGRLRQLEVVVPVGSTASVCLPAGAEKVRESGRRLRTGRGIQSISPEGEGAVRVEVGQGRYCFALE